MAILHTMHNKNWDNGFATDENAILVKTPYRPEALILGTYNPDTAVNNPIADFFYGRNYFWPAIHNLQNNDPASLQQRRDVAHLPALKNVFELNVFFKFSFADLIRSVMHNGDPEYQIVGNVVQFSDQEYNLIEDNALVQLNHIGQVDWNVEAIINYLTNTPTINTVYLTRQPTGSYQQPWLSLVNYLHYGRPIEFMKIYTPSAQALPGAPRIGQLLHHWIKNESPNYDRICHEYLRIRGIDPDLF